MTLDELHGTVAAITGMPKTTAAKAVAATLHGIQSGLKSGAKVAIPGFGVFEVSHRPAREGRHPQTGAAMTIAAANAVKFKPGKNLKEAVNAA